MTDLNSSEQELKVRSGELRRVVAALRRLIDDVEHWHDEHKDAEYCLHCWFQERIAPARALLGELEENEK